MSDPREAEAKGFCTVDFRGVTLTFPTEYDEYPMGFIEAVNGGAGPDVQARELLGPDQWAQVRPLLSKGRDLNELVSALDVAQGTDAGEEAPSPN